MMQSASCHWASMNTTCNYDLYKRLIFKKKLFSRLHTNAEYQERITDLAPVQQVAYSSTSRQRTSRSSFDNDMIIDPSVFSNDGIFTVLLKFFEIIYSVMLKHHQYKERLQKSKLQQLA
jgi:hypothetical protein